MEVSDEHRIAAFFQEHLSANHLDVGVGSGYYLAHSSDRPEQKVTLLDLNDNSLKAAGSRIAHLQPSLVRDDVLQPSGALGDRKFDSISLFYLLHCLPGNMAEKGRRVFSTLGAHLAPGGVLYGATILGDEANHNWIGRRLMKLYNRKGILETSTTRRKDCIRLSTSTLPRLPCGRSERSPCSRRKSRQLNSSCARWTRSEAADHRLD